MEIVRSSVSIPASGGGMGAHLARPASEEKFPAVIVVMEAFGLNQHIKSVADRIAAEGYVAIAPDVYYREPNAVVGYDNLAEAIRLMMGLADDDIVKDMSAVVSYLREQSFVHGDRIGMTGFCMGGRITFLTACRNPAIKAAVPFYGGGIASVMQPGERTPRAPLEYADQLACPMLLFFGENDPFIPLSDVEKIRDRLAQLGKQAEVVVYPGAPHGFFCEERDSYRADAASDSWERLRRFFATHLKGQTNLASSRNCLGKL